MPYENYLLYTARSIIQPGLQKYASTSSMSSSVSNSSTFSITPETSEQSKECTILESNKNDSLDLGNIPKNEEQSPVENLNVRPNNTSAKSILKTKSPPNIESGSRNQAKPGDPGFVAEFYNHSRLHYLSTWGAEFRVYVNELHAKGGNSYPGRDGLKHMAETNSFDSTCSPQYPSQQKLTDSKLNKIIMHIDMDCFFVSVGLRNRPDLVG